MGTAWQWRYTAYMALAQSATSRVSILGKEPFLGATFCCRDAPAPATRQIIGTAMTRLSSLIAGATVLAAGLGSHPSQVTADGVLDEGRSPTLATGYRTSKVVGSTVINESLRDGGNDR